MIRRAIYPGSFDPVTYGHLDIIERASRMFDEIVVAVLINPNKTSMFSMDERIEMLNEVIAKKSAQFHAQIKVGTFGGLLAEFAVQQEAQAVIRGIRAISDYDYEQQLALMNRRLAPSVETVFLLSAQEYSFLSSRLVKEVFTYGGNVDGLVPPLVIERMHAKIQQGVK
ncbi:MAG TPA: pantetheine-phosphate adenylyltransferase [Blastocatellia bacterium]|nr:pantetheine-phosphate adenylyltransferase [Blastocatellia bacterium]